MKSKDPYIRLDQDIRIDNLRHAGIVVHEEKILLIKRIYEGYEYYTFPGGHQQEGEDGAQTVLREIEEETTIIAQDPELVFQFEDIKNNKRDFYYLCVYMEGTPELSGEELLRHSDHNYYEPMWISFNEFLELNVLPKFAEEWVRENIISSGPAD